MFRISFFATLLVWLSLSMGQQALAQAETDKPEVEKPAVVDESTLIAPYDSQLLRLSEVLGSIHFLRELCKANEGQLWRQKMTALIEAENPRPSRKSRMISRFNRGYGAFSSYRSCTPAALVAVNNYMKEGVRLTSQITTRFGSSN